MIKTSMAIPQRWFFILLIGVIKQPKQQEIEQIIKETKQEIALIEEPKGLYDLIKDEVLPDADIKEEFEE